MNLIAAVDGHWGIGKDNKLLAYIPEDMKFFRNTTTGNVVVMGRKTLESFPGKKPLKNRVNIVLTKDEAYQVEGAKMVHSIDELKERLAQYENDTIYVIGGESIYRQLEPLCNRAFITKIDATYPADAHFPNLDEMDDWELETIGEMQKHEDISYAFTVYVRK